MKISIITPCLNSEDTLCMTLASVISQSYKNIEHILVDGGSKDQSKQILKEYEFKNKKIFFLENFGLYESINYGIEKSSGEYIGILNSDDIYNNNFVIEKIVEIIKEKKNDIYFGDTVYFNYKKLSKVVRYYNNIKFTKKDLIDGIMPSHTSTFVNSKIYRKIGLYNNTYKIAGDFDFFFRAIYKNNIKYEYINKILTRMRTGGISGKNIKSYWTTTKEIVRSINECGIKVNALRILTRIPKKIPQFLNLDQNKLNLEFEFPNYKKYKNFFYDFRIIYNLNKLNLRNNFILSALNLAYLASYLQKEISFNKDLINWPDGIFTKQIIKNVKKIPGRDVINKLILDNNIEKILVYGNLTDVGKCYLKKKFHREIYHENLEYGSCDKIFNKIKKKIFEKNELVFLTLPTPKQEIIAEMFSKININYKIICIGGSISIASGEEKEVPKIFSSYFEWLWRLRYETVRRTNRLFSTLTNYYKFRFLSKKISNLTYKIID